MARVQRLALHIPQGSDYVHTFLYTETDGITPINLTGFTARLQIRQDYESVNFEYEATTANDLTINGPLGQIDLQIPNATTAAWTWDEGVYDLEIVSATSVVTRILQGTVSVSREVTR